MLEAINVRCSRGDASSGSAADKALGGGFQDSAATWCFIRPLCYGLLRSQSDGSICKKPQILKVPSLRLTCGIVSHSVHEGGDLEKKSYDSAVRIWLHIRITWRAFTIPVPKSHPIQIKSQCLEWEPGTTVFLKTPSWFQCAVNFAINRLANDLSKITQLGTGTYHGSTPLFLAKTDPCPKNEVWVDIVSFTITLQGEYVAPVH